MALHRMLSYFGFLLLAVIASGQDKTMLTVAERKEVQNLIAEYRQVRGQAEKRLAVIDKAGKLGAGGIRPLLDVTGKELQKSLSDYRALFTRAATQAFAERASGSNLQEVAELRQRVLDLSQKESLSYEEIKQISDPALAKLKEILLIPRENVLEKAKQLEKPRAALLVLGKEWDRCQAYLREPADKTPTTESKAETGPQSKESTEVSFADYLTQDEELSVAMAMPMDAITRQSLAANAQLASKLDPEEARCILDANLTRNLLGLNTLRTDLTLGEAARGHSSDMEKHNFFAHDSPVPGKATPWDRAKLAGTTASGENIAMGTTDGVAASKMWWHSPGHHKNMLGKHQRIGVGRHNKHWTELFGN